MMRTLPFAALGLIATAGFVSFGSSAPAAGSGASTVAQEDGSVLVTAQLERTHLVAGESGEAFARVMLEGIQAPTSTDRMPVSLTVVIDRSGSMSGDKIERAREAAISALSQLQPGDRASVVAFGSRSNVLVEQVTIGDGTIEDANRQLRRLSASGGTNMAAALRDAKQRSLALYSSERVNRVLLLSDGRPDQEGGLAAQVKELSRLGIVTTTLGVGRDYNEDLMSQLADSGLGNYYFVEHAAQLAGIFNKELKSLSAVVAKEAVLTVATASGVEVLEVFGWEMSRGVSTTAIPVGDIFSGRKAEILMKVRVPARAAGDASLIDVKVSYHDAIANKAVIVARGLEATFTEDRKAVVASIVHDVVQKREQVLTAQALEKASEAYARGDKKEARDIVRRQKDSVDAFAAAAPAAYASGAADMAGSMNEFEEDADGDFEVAKKKAKARARTFRR
jgi:Ca-activated chloride channel family protein